MPRTIRGIIKERERKHEKKNEELAEVRKEQWEDELLKTVVTALPRSKPDKIKEIMEEIEADSPCDYPAAEEALDAIGFLKENTNGAHPEKFWSEPHQILLAEAYTACAKQNYKWKFIPVYMLHPFVARVCVLTSVTGKRIPRSDMMQMERMAQNIYSNLSSVIDRICANVEKGDEPNGGLLKSLREIYPGVLTSHDSTAVNSVLDDSVEIRDPQGVPEWIREACTDSDGKADGFFLDEEDLFVMNDDNDDNNDNNKKGKDIKGNQKGKTDSDESFAIETLSISDDANRNQGDAVTPVTTRLRERQALPTPVPLPVAKDPVKDDSNDFTSSLSNSYMESVLNSNKKYQATPPPPRVMGKYSMVPPLNAPTESTPRESSPVVDKQRQGSSRNQSETATEEASGPKRMASPSTLQPAKLQRVENSQAEIRRLRMQLREQTSKVASLDQCIQDMRLQQHRRDAARELQEREWRRTSRRLQHTNNHEGFLEQRRQHQQRQQQGPQGRNRARSMNDLQYSAIRRSLGPRTSAHERTNRLIARESLGGMIQPSSGCRRGCSKNTIM